MSVLNVSAVGRAIDVPIGTTNMGVVFRGKLRGEFSRRERARNHHSFGANFTPKILFHH
jgi:hypothetical protein